MLQGGTATSVRLRGGPNAYHRVAVAAGGDVTVEVRVWDDGRWTTRMAGAADARSLARIDHRRTGDALAVALEQFGEQGANRAGALSQAVSQVGRGQ